MLTVYRKLLEAIVYTMLIFHSADSGLINVQDSDLVSLGYQIKNYEDAGRTVYLRFAPEMGGIWNPGWALMPTLYKSTWIRMYTIIKQIAP